MGVETKNILRYVSMNQIYLSLGQLLLSALPAFHALFGCDYTGAFSRKGKVCPFNCLENSEEAQCTFVNLAVDLPSIKEEVSDTEKYICALYAKRKLDSVNYARFQIFYDQYKKKDEYQSVTKVKSFDLSRMPPCKKVLTEKIKTTKLVARKWMTSVDALQPVWCPAEFGWKLDDGKQTIKWYDGKVAPRWLDIVCTDGSTEDETGWYY